MRSVLESEICIWSFNYTHVSLDNAQTMHDQKRTKSGGWGTDKGNTMPSLKAWCSKAKFGIGEWKYIREWNMYNSKYHHFFFFFFFGGGRGCICPFCPPPPFPWIHQWVGNVRQETLNDEVMLEILYNAAVNVRSKWEHCAMCGVSDHAFDL